MDSWIVPPENLTPEQRRKDEYVEYLNDLMSKAPGTSEGLDDFVQGGNTQFQLENLQLAASAGLVVGALKAGIGGILML